MHGLLCEVINDLQTQFCASIYIIVTQNMVSTLQYLLLVVINLANLSVVVKG